MKEYNNFTKAAKIVYLPQNNIAVHLRGSSGCWPPTSPTYSPTQLFHTFYCLPKLLKGPPHQKKTFTSSLHTDMASAVAPMQINAPG